MSSRWKIPPLQMSRRHQPADAKRVTNRRRGLDLVIAHTVLAVIVIVEGGLTSAELDIVWGIGRGLAHGLWGGQKNVPSSGFYIEPTGLVHPLEPTSTVPRVVVAAEASEMTVSALVTRWYTPSGPQALNS